MIMATVSEIKPFIKATDMNNNDFRVGDYIGVLTDFSYGYNMLTGCNFVKKVDDTLLITRYTPFHNGGRHHNNIPTQSTGIG